MNAIEKFKWEIDRRRVHSTATELPAGISMITLTLTIQEAKDLLAEIKTLQEKKEWNKVLAELRASNNWLGRLISDKFQLANSDTQCRAVKKQIRYNKQTITKAEQLLKNGKQ